MFGGFPPPAAGADILTGLDRTRAGCAADAWKSLVVKGVVRYVVGMDVFPNLRLAPIGERVEFGDSAMGEVQFDLGQADSGDRLFVTLTRARRRGSTFRIPQHSLRFSIDA